MQGKNFKTCLDLTMITKPRSFRNINRAPQLCQALCWAPDLKDARGMAPALELMGSASPPSRTPWHLTRRTKSYGLSPL